MKPLEVVRFVCGECGIGFDITVAPYDEWCEQLDVEADGEPMVMPDAECPFCGARELRQASDRPIIKQS